jgi:hypothetical protein
MRSPSQTIISARTGKLTFVLEAFIVGKSGRNVPVHPIRIITLQFPPGSLSPGQEPSKNGLRIGQRFPPNFEVFLVIRKTMPVYLQSMVEKPRPGGRTS